MHKTLSIFGYTSLAFYLHRILQLGSILSQLALFMPWMENMVRILSLGHLSLIADRVMGFKEIYQFMRDQIDERATSRVKDQPRDMTDAYLDKIEETTDMSSSFHKIRKSTMQTTKKLVKYVGLQFTIKNPWAFSYSDKYHEAFTGDLFIAGIDTTGTTLEWLLTYMAQNPSVQKKLQEEIDTIVGDSRLPSLADRKLMPYADAVMHELLRLSSIAPLGVPHKAMKDLDFHGYRIPKDTMIFANLHAVHHDPTVYKNPGAFLPERFFGDEGKILKKETFFAFSIGKRRCKKEKQHLKKFNMFNKPNCCRPVFMVYLNL